MLGGIAKDFEFSRRTMPEHWQSGYADAVATFSHPEVLQRPPHAGGAFAPSILPRLNASRVDG
jgi:NTE family protein